MKSDQKVITSILVVSIGACSLASTSTLAAKTKLRVWLNPDFMWSQLALGFEKENPNVDVVLVGATMEKFYTMITAGLMPDVWGPWDTPGITADVNRNWALDLEAYIKRDSKELKINDFFPGLMKQFKVRGRQYSLPIFSYTDWYFYKPESYARAGLTPPPIDAGDKNWRWERMVANAQKMTKHSPDGGRITEPGLEFSRGFQNTPNWVHLWGVELYNAEALKTSIPQAIDVESSQMQRALKEMWDLIYRYKVAAPVAQEFRNMKTASSIEYGWNVFNYMSVKSLKWAMAPLPWAVTNSGTLWPDGLRISRISKNKELAWKFVKYVCSPESMQFIATHPKSERRGSAMARKSVFQATLGNEIGKVTGMKPEDVFRVNEQADEVGIVKATDTICLHKDLARTYLEPVLNDLWANKFGPDQAPGRLGEVARRGMPILFNRWMRNVKYTGVKL